MQDVHTGIIIKRSMRMGLNSTTTMQDYVECTKRGITVPDEMMHFIKVLLHGNDKGYDADGWLHGVKFDHDRNSNSMFHHLSESYVGQIADKESGLHPLLHLACRALMEYTVQMRAKADNVMTEEEEAMPAVEFHQDEGLF